MLEPEADELERQLVRPDVRRKRSEQSLTELAQRQVRCVKDDVGVAPYRVEPTALLRDRAGDAALIAERVSMTGLAEAADEHVVARLEEDDPRPDPATLERATHRGHRQRRVAGPNVEHDGDTSEARTVRRDQLGQVRQELTGQIVHDRVAEVLEELGGRRLAAAGQAADDDDGRLAHRVGRGPGLGLAGHRPLRRMNRTVNSNRMYIVPPRTNGLTRSPPGVTTAAKMEMPRMM